MVDDEPDVLVYLAAAFEDAGHRVRGFGGAEGLVEEARRAPPDLICLDIMMPDRSGLSLYRELKTDERLARIPVVIVSGYSRREEFLDGEFQRLLGVDGCPAPDGFVEKPMKVEDLVELVARLLSPEAP